MKLRFLLVALVLILFRGSPLLAANSDTGSPVIEVWKSTTCQCCGNWVKHLEANGFDAKVNAADPSLLDRVRKDAGISDKLAACHTAKIDGYFIEGHVPGTDIKRLMDEKPAAIGLTVPGMAMGSPGMEQGTESRKIQCAAHQEGRHDRSVCKPLANGCGTRSSIMRVPPPQRRSRHPALARDKTTSSCSVRAKAK